MALDITMGLNPRTLVSIARSACVVCAVVGASLTVLLSGAAAPSACCNSIFWYLVLRIAADFAAAPALCALLITSTSILGRAAFWISCIYLGVFVLVPYFVPLSALCIWAQLRWALHIKTIANNTYRDFSRKPE